MTIMESIPLGTMASTQVTEEERQLLARNHGLPAEALRYDTTPIGMHYLLTHYDVPAVDPAVAWTLRIQGAVMQPSTIPLDAIRRRPRVTRRVTFECAGNGRTTLQPRPMSQPWGVEAVGTAEWTGTRLRPLLEEAGLRDGSTSVVFSGADVGIEGGITQRYERGLTVDEALRDDVLLVYGINGQELPPQHGFPLRLVVPGWYGMTNVKWLQAITVLEHDFDGYQQRSYSLRRTADEPGQRIDRMRPRALMVPPGIPEVLTRERYVATGAIKLEGRAWSGTAPIAQVDVTTDGGATWAPAELGPQPDPYAWVRWTAVWDARAGSHRLGCRATDAAGRVQPLEPTWNLEGFACNGVHFISLTVSKDDPAAVASVGDG